MTRTANGHSAEYIKRQAKNIKKELDISYAQALDEAAIRAGFTGWEHFINKSDAIVSPKSIVNGAVPVKPVQLLKIGGAKLPKPLVVGFNLPFSNTRLQRPNARMSIASHQEIGGMLKILRRATKKNKRAHRALSDVTNQLDEWVQKEYTSREELSDDVFFRLYYGDVDVIVENPPTLARVEELDSLCHKTKLILKSSYHDCSPVRELLRQMDLAIKWINAWPVAKPERSNRKDVAVPAGSLVYLNSKNNKAVLISHNAYSGVVVCYTDQGPVTTSRSSITVPKDQSGVEAFRPMRLWLPYGMSTCSDGKQVLFNRDYIPLWIKSPDGIVVTVSPDTSIEKSDTDFFFKDDSAPWNGNKQTQARCMEALQAWGVETQVPDLLALLPVAIANNDVSLLMPERSRV